MFVRCNGMLIYMRNELFRYETLPPSTSRPMKTKFSKLDQENLAIKKQVWGKQYPSDKIFFRGYGEYGESRIIKNNQEYDKADTEKQKDISDDIKVRSNFKVNHASYFCEETYNSKS